MNEGEISVNLSERAALHGMSPADYVALRTRQRTIANEAEENAHLRAVKTYIAKSAARKQCFIAIVRTAANSRLCRFI